MQQNRIGHNTLIDNVMLYFQLDQERKYYSVVFPERRSLEMAETICKLHGGHLPVPINDMENDV